MNESIVAYDSQTLNALAERIRTIQRANQQVDRNIIICIAGGSSTGKSTQVAQGLFEHLQPDAQLLSQDNFQLGRDCTERADSMYGWDALENYGLFESQHLLETLKRNWPTQLPVYSFAEGRRTGIQPIHPTSISLFEGLYAGFGELRAVADLLIYIELPLVARVLRRLFRSCFERYRAEPARSLRSIATGGMLKAHRDLVRQQRPTADLILQMPYRFADTIQRFGLIEQPHSFQSESTLFSFPIDNKSELRVEVAEKGERHLCLLYQSKLYFSFLIDDETFDWLNTADLTAY